MEKLTYTEQNGFLVPDLTMDEMPEQTQLGTLREAAGEVPDGAPQGTVQLDADDRQAVDASDGDRPAGGGDVGPRDGAAGTDDGRDREAESGKVQMAWVQQMNNIRHSAEESVLSDLIYA